MSLLLDTQVVLWCLGDPSRLGAAARRRIEAPGELVFVSSVSVWEIEIKRALGKLEAPDDLAAQLLDKRLTELPLHHRHVPALRSLPKLHRDPFDRMLVAQALTDDLLLITADEPLRAYPVKTLRA